MKNQSKLLCDMKKGCTQPVTHIDVKGFAYCKEHGVQRKNSMSCRQLKPKELKLLLSGKPLAKY